MNLWTYEQFIHPVLLSSLVHLALSTCTPLSFYAFYERINWLIDPCSACIFKRSVAETSVAQFWFVNQTSACGAYLWKIHNIYSLRAKCKQILELNVNVVNVRVEELTVTDSVPEFCGSLLGGYGDFGFLAKKSRGVNRFGRFLASS